MARIRTIKPEFCVSEQLAECSRNARLVFALMWMFCDDQGIHPAKHRTLKAEVFPLDEAVTTADMKEWVDELLDHGLLREYQVGSERYWIVTGWAKHQKIDKPSKKHPLPLSEDSPNPPRIIADSSPPEGKGMESKGREESKPPGKAQHSEAPTSPRARTPDSPRCAALTALAEEGRVPIDARARMHLRQWADEGITDQQMADALAIARERKTHPLDRIPINLLVSIMPDVLRGAKPPDRRTAAQVAKDVTHAMFQRDAEQLGAHWWEDPHKVQEKGREEGVKVIPNQPFEEYQARVLTASGNGPWMADLPDPLRARVEHYRAVGVNP